jgi:hypothetical protein
MGSFLKQATNRIGAQLALAADVARCVAASQVRYHFASLATPLKRRSVGRRTQAMANAIFFFATRSDILPVLEVLESKHALKYVEMGSFTVAQPLVISRALDLPNLGAATAGDKNHVPSFMIMPWDDKIECEVVPQRRGGVRYIFGHPRHRRWDIRIRSGDRRRIWYLLRAGPVSAVVSAGTRPDSQNI